MVLVVRARRALVVFFVFASLWATIGKASAQFANPFTDPVGDVPFSWTSPPSDEPPLTDFTGAKALYQHLVAFLQNAASKQCMSAAYKAAILKTAQEMLDLLKTGYPVNRGANAVSYPIKKSDWKKNSPNSSVEELMEQVAHKLPCPPPGMIWVYDLDSGNYTLIFDRPQVLSFSNMTPDVGVGIEKRWVDNHWETINQYSLGGPDFVASPTLQYVTDPVRLKLFAGVDARLSYSWLIGAVVDLGIGTNSGTRPGIPGSFGPGGLVSAAVAANDSVTLKQSWNSSVRARFGVFITPTLLFYGTAGVDFLHATASINCTLAGACGLVGTPVAASASTTAVGGVFGGGFDLNLGGNWRGRLEYLHSTFGTWNASIGNPATFQTIAHIKLDTDSVMMGFVYAFGSSGPTPSPVVKAVR